MKRNIGGYANKDVIIPIMKSMCSVKSSLEDCQI